MPPNTPVCDFGWTAPEFSLPDPSGTLHSKSALMGDGGLLIAFICNHCPYVKVIGDRLAEDARALKEAGVNTVAIMSNDFIAYPADAPDKMVKFAQHHGFDFPYLIDEDQSVARAYDAVCTPDFFGLNAKGELQYRGRLDDAQMGDASARTPELLNAMKLVAATGAGPQAQTPSMGCSIKWK